jgi:hypothetical protein
MDRSELERQFRIIDMMLTGHSALRDKYRRLALGLDLILVSISIVVTGLALLDQRVFVMLGLDPAKTQLGLGMASLVLLVASVLGMLVDWKGARERHGRAVAVLAALKTATRGVLTLGHETSSDQIGLRWRENSLALDTLPEIPERLFHRLKARHLRKVELSRLLDERCAFPIWVLRLFLVWRSIRGKGEPQGRRK